MSGRSLPLFTDLVFTEGDERVSVAMIGNEPFYAISEDGFLRHVEAGHVDRQIVKHLQQQIKAMGDTVINGVLELLGEDGIFTQVAVQHAIDSMDRILDGDVADIDQFRTTLWMGAFVPSSMSTAICSGLSSQAAALFRTARLVWLQ